MRPRVEFVLPWVGLGVILQVLTNPWFFMVPALIFGLRSILFLDHHVEHLKKLGATGTQPGIRLNFEKKNIKTAWPDQFAPYEIEGCCLSSGNFEGTLIRAPLRTASSSSQIKAECFGEEEIAKIIDLICQSGHLWLPFFEKCQKD